MPFEKICELTQSVWPGWVPVRMIGKGSFGTVYEIQKLNGGRIDSAALKVIAIPEEGTALPMTQNRQTLHAHYVSIAEDMVREYEIMSRLKKAGCQNVVGCDSYVKLVNEDGLGLKLLIQMELLTDLNTYVRRNGITRQAVIQLGIDICKALEACKREHVIHRDIKPANLFISNDGVYKLGDFGVAKRLEESGYAASKQGTLLYMAPEVYANREYDIRADLYSLGLVMYQMMNGGELPFASGTLDEQNQGDSLRRRMRGDILPLPAAEKGDLAQVVCRASAYDCKDRYASPMEMRHALEYLADPDDDTMYLLPVDTEPEVQIRYLDKNGMVFQIHSYRPGQPVNVPKPVQQLEENGVRYTFDRWDPVLPQTAERSMDCRAVYKSEKMTVVVPGGRKAEKDRERQEREQKKQEEARQRQEAKEKEAKVKEEARQEQERKKQEEARRHQEAKEKEAKAKEEARQEQERKKQEEARQRQETKQKAAEVKARQREERKREKQEQGDPRKKQGIFLLVAVVCLLLCFIAVWKPWDWGKVQDEASANEQDELHESVGLPEPEESKDPWSEWLTELPSNVDSSGYEIETKQQYRSAPAVYSEDTIRSGYTLCSQECSDWGPMVGWQTTPVEASDTVKVETRTVYKYKISSYQEIGNEFHTNTRRQWVTGNNWKYSYEPVYVGQKFSKTSKVAEVETYLEYDYCERSLIYCYVKNGTWSEYQDEVICPNEDTVVNVRTVYRYADKMGQDPEVTATMDNFRFSGTDYSGRFWDVTADSWYGGSDSCVGIVVELGAMVPNEYLCFRPDESATLAEVIRAAAIVHQTYYGNDELIAEEGNFMVYITYALENQLIRKADFGDYTAEATRAQAAYIFWNALPIQELPGLNIVSKVTDMELESPYYKAVYQMAQAGIFAWPSPEYAFGAEKLVTRAEVAAIVDRIVRPEKRLAAD